MQTCTHCGAKFATDLIAFPMLCPKDEPLRQAFLQQERAFMKRNYSIADKLILKPRPTSVNKTP